MRTKQHLIVLDLDGTLLTNKKTITPKTKTLITKLINQGHIVVIATGRSHRMSSFYYEHLNLNTPIINSNGALLHHPKDKNWGSFHQPLDKEFAHDIIDMSYATDSKNILAKVIDSIYLDQHDDRILNFYQPSNQVEPVIIGRVKEKLQTDPTIMLIYPEESEVDKLALQLASYLPDSVQLRNWGPPFFVLEVMRKGMNKAASLKRIADSFDIPRERIIAFGDEGNDIEMIDYAGIGIAMENASEELKQVANYVTDSNENEGVRKFLESYFKVDRIII